MRLVGEAGSTKIVVSEGKKRGVWTLLEDGVNLRGFPQQPYHKVRCGREVGVSRR